MKQGMYTKEEVISSMLNRNYVPVESSKDYIMTFRHPSGMLCVNFQKREVDGEELWEPCF